MEQYDREKYLAQLVSTRAGQAHQLTVSVLAEEGDELGIFDMVAAAVDEPRLERLVRRHQADEARHAELFRGCLDRLGLELQDLPAELQLIRQLVHHVGSFELGVHSPAALAGTYALLHAIERRGVEQFPLIARAFRPVDEATADTYLAVTKDEKRHIKYCETLGRHFSDDDATWQRLVEQAQQVERAAYDQVRQADVDYTTRHGLLAAA